MRKLSDTFLRSLKSGFLAGITQKVIEDFDLNLEIRNNYLNVYYKGNSLLKLNESTPTRYRVDIHKKFKAGLEIPSELVNQDITRIQDQLERYYENIKPKAASIAAEGEIIFRQKLELGLYNQSRERIEAMKTLTFSQDISQFQFILVLVDYNPNSFMLNLEKIAKLPLASQIKVFRCRSAMWQQNVKPLACFC